MSRAIEVTHLRYPDLTDFAYALLTLANRPEIRTYGASVQDANGATLDTIILIESSDGNGGRRYGARLATSDTDSIASLREGDEI